MSNPKQWEFPGGKVEMDEDLPQALVREIREELAIEIEVDRLLGSTAVEIGTVEAPCCIELDVFICRWLSGDIVLVEHRDWRWVDSRELVQLDWSRADRPLLADLLRHLEGPIILET